MPLNPTSLPKWLTETPDPSGIIGRGSAAGGQAADARLGAERLMAQREQFAQEFTLKQAQLDMEAQKAAAMLAARDQELEIRKILGQSELAKDAAMSLRASQEYKLKADESARKLMAQDQYLKTGDFDQYLRITSPAAAAQLQGRQLSADERALANKQRIDAQDERANLDRLFKGSEGDKNRAVKKEVADAKPDPELERLNAQLSQAVAEYNDLPAPTGKIIDKEKDERKERARIKLSGLRAKVAELEKQRGQRGPQKAASLFDEFLNSKKEQ